MANRQKETQFKPGQSGNPAGRPKVPEALKRANRLTKERLMMILNELIHMEMAELDKKLKDPSATMLELAVGRIIQKAAKEGDTNRLNFLFDRIVGKVTDMIEQTTTIKEYDPMEYEEVPREALLKLVEEVGR